MIVRNLVSSGGLSLNKTKIQSGVKGAEKGRGGRGGTGGGYESRDPH